MGTGNAWIWLQLFLILTAGALVILACFCRGIEFKRLRRINRSLAQAASCEGEAFDPPPAGPLEQLEANAGRLAALVERKTELEHTLDQAEQTWSTAFSVMAEGVAVCDARHRLLRANRSMARFIGIQADQQSQASCFDAMRRCLFSAASPGQAAALREGRSVSFEFEPEGGDRFWQVSIAPIKSGSHGISGYVYLVEDLSEQTQLRQQLLQSEKMASLGQLLSGVAHELNNPLTVVLGYSQLLLSRCQDSGQKEMIADLEAILGETRHAAKIVQNLLSFGRKRLPQKSPIDVNAAIAAALELRSYEVDHSQITITTALAELPLAWGDSHQLQQVFLNLIINAEQAIDAAGRRQGEIKISSKLRSGSIVVTVRDNGQGIEAKNLGHIFEPFFSTKEAGRGTGLGLSISHGIVEDHGGELRVASRCRRGTVFRVKLPVVQAAQQRQEPREVEPLAGHARRRVLVVDDEPAVTGLLAAALLRQGHGVEIAPSGAAALRKLTHGEYDRVITDIRMPEMDGKELHRRIREIDPQLADKTIFITGDSVSTDLQNFLADSGNLYLIKPFSPQDLWAAMASG